MTITSSMGVEKYQCFILTRSGAVFEALADASGGFAIRVRRADLFRRADGRVSNSFELTLGSKRRALTRDAADQIRVRVETAAERLGFDMRTEKMGRRISKPRPWVIIIIITIIKEEHPGKDDMEP